jgi:hypothetical protein
LEALSSLEFILQAGFGAAALAVASWAAWKRAQTASSSPQTGELAWTVVAIAVLACVSAAVGFGGAHGI